MSLNRTRPNEIRTPDFIELPDGRKRLVRYFDLASGANLTDGLVEAYGTVDVGPATGTTAGFAGLRLVDQRLLKLGENSVYQKTYEELPATAELQVGGATTGNTTIKFEDGRTGYEAEFLQLVAGSYTPGTVGTTTAPGDASAYLQREECTNDGALRRIKRTYVYAGQIAQTDDTRNNGALLLRTIVSVKTVPSTPSGYTLVATKSDPNAGLPVLTYTFAKGDGQISQDDTTSNNGALLRRTIRHLVAPATANPISTPAGYTLVDESYQENEGHRLWTSVFAKGDGQISQDDTTSNNGALLRRTIRHLVAPAASNPIANISLYTRIDLGYQDLDGHRIWTAVFVKGSGQISQDDSTSNNGALLRRTIRHLVAPSTANPISTPAGYTLVDESYQEADGHRIWTSVFAKGDGEVSRDIDYSQSSDQGTTGVTRTTIRHLVAPAATVQPTSLSGSVEIARTFQDVDGHRLWTTVWAKGTGTVITETTYPVGGGSYLGTVYARVARHHHVALGSAPSTPSPVISGATVQLVSSVVRAEAGFDVYDYHWVEARGIISDRYQEQPGGLRIISREIATTLTNASADTATYLPTGILLESSFQEMDGWVKYTLVVMQKSDGTMPTTGTATSYTTRRQFTYPGRAKVISTSVQSETTLDVFKSPPITVWVDATVTIKYTSTSNPSPTATLWNPTEWTTIIAKFTDLDSYPRRIIETLPGYRAVSTTATTFDGGLSTATQQTCLGVRVIPATSGTPYELQLTGGPSAPDGNTYALSYEVEPAFVNTAAQQFYRTIEVSATIPAQPSLPV